MSQQITLTRQSTSNSCWAACIEMATFSAKKQCALINDEGAVAARGGCDCVMLQQSNPDLSSRNNEWTNNFWNCQSTGVKSVDEMVVILKNPYEKVSGSVSYNNLAGLNRNNSPVIYMYSFGNTTSKHVVVLGDCYTQTLIDPKKKIKWIRVYDPFPLNSGRQYYMTYEQFISTVRISFSSLIVNKDKISNIKSADGADLSYLGNIFLQSFNVGVKNFVRKFVAETRNSLDIDFKQLTKFNKQSVVLDLDFSVSYVSNQFVLDGNQMSGVLGLLNISVTAAMCLLEFNKNLTSIYVSFEDDYSGIVPPKNYYISQIENGDKFRLLIDIQNNFANLYFEENTTDEAEMAFSEYFTNDKEKEFLILRFMEAGLEFVFFRYKNRVIVFDPYSSFYPLVKSDAAFMTYDKFRDVFTNLFTNHI